MTETQLQTQGIDENNIWSLYLYAMKSPVTRQKYQKRLEKFLSGLVNIHGKHPVSTDGGTWYPQACKFLRLKHQLHSFFWQRGEKHY